MTLGALLLALAIGVPLGMRAALRPDGWVDGLCSAISTLGQATPTFFLGLMLVFVFYYLLGWAPAPLGRLDSMLASAAGTDRILVASTRRLPATCRCCARCSANWRCRS